MDNHRTPRRLGGRLLGAAALAAVAALLGVAVARDQRPDAAPRDPPRGGDVVAQLLDVPGEGVVARGAVRVPQPLDEVWAAVTDYEHFGDVCPFVAADEVRYDPGGPCTIRARVRTGAGGEVPVAAAVWFTQELTRYTAAWDGPGGDVTRNRGRWVLTAADGGGTLVELYLDVEMRRVPAFVMRDVSRRRVGVVLEHLRRRLADGPSGKAW